MSTIDDKRYINMEAVLQAINKSYISLAEDQIKKNNPIMKMIIEDVLIPRMKLQNPMFNLMYTNILYGGSYYDGLKVGKPEEYDLDFVMSLPKVANPQFIESDVAGYVHIQLPLLEKLKKQPEGPKYSDLDKLLDENKFILAPKFRSWVEGIIQKVLNGFQKENKSAVFKTEVRGVSYKFYIETVKSGPAHTLKIACDVDEEKIVMDVDIVPSIKCSKWPESADYRPNPSSKKTDFCAVPKEPTRDASMEKYWRLSFQEQERELINGCNKMKPIIRILKRLRDFQKHDLIASYYIKSIFLRTLDDEQLNKRWYTDSLSCCFMKGLELYESHLRKHDIPFYWNTKNNLLSNIKEDTCIGYANKIKKIFNEINNKIELDPFIVAKYLLSQDDIESLKSSVTLGAKVEKRVIASHLLHSCSRSSISTNSTELGVLNEFNCTNSVIMRNPLEMLSYEALQNSFDAVDGTALSTNKPENEVYIEILKELRSINGKLSRIEKKVDDVSKRLRRLEDSESLSNGLAGLRLVEDVVSPFIE